MEYKLSVPLALFGFLPFAVAVFAVLPARRAVLVVLFSGWMFLPQAGYTFEGIPNYTKASAISLALMVGVVFFDPQSLLALRPRWYDFPVWVLAAGSMATSLSNNLGVYNGLSGMFTVLITVGVPYVIGRAYFSSLAGLRELAAAFFIAALVYTPLVLWEARLSPQLCQQVYGFRARPFGTAVRLGGYRPEVFMITGLVLSLWLGSGLLCGLWLWMMGAVRKVGPFPTELLLAVLFLTFALSRSLGAYALVCLGLGCLLSIKYVGMRTTVVLLLLIPAFLYISLRFTGAWSGEELVEMSRQAAGSHGDARAQSLEWRMRQENLLRDHFWERPWLGWGGFGRDRDHLEGFRGVDSLWMITLGNYGIIGLGATMLLVYLPLLMLRSRLPARAWTTPAASGAVACAIVLAIWWLDCLFNGFRTPIHFVISGALMGLVPVSMGGARSVSPAPGLEGAPTDSRSTVSVLR